MGVGSIGKEYKKFGIVSARTPQTGKPLAGVVRVVNGGDRGFVYIRFSDAFVLAVGRAMPQGIAEHQPCYLKAVRMLTGKWRVWAYYLGIRKGRLLWEADKLEWVGNIRKGANRATHSEKEKGSDGRTRRDAAT